MVSKKKNTIVSRIMDELGGDVSTSSMFLKLHRDLCSSTDIAPRKEVRYLVDLYYQIQDMRIASAAQCRTLKEGGEPSMLPDFISANLRYLEDTIKRSMGSFAKQYVVGKWLQSICGIGPVLSAGFLVTFDIRDMPTSGAWHSYAGIAPGIEWKKGNKRPWDARAKVMCFKAGESFVKVQSRENDFYGKFFVNRRQYEQDRNDRGELADQAAEKLSRFKIGKKTDAYKAYSNGKLPPAHLHARARRYTVKLFLSHFHDVAWRDYYGTEPPVPYVFSTKYTGGVHRHYIDPPPCDFKGRSLRELWPEDDEYFEIKKKREEKRLGRGKSDNVK